MLTSELREIFSSPKSRLGVPMGLGPQKDDSMSMVCGEPERRPDEEEEMDETLVMPGGGLAADWPASTRFSISAPKTEDVAEAPRRASISTRLCSLPARLASIIRKL
jgi:hypothetical protein